MPHAEILPELAEMLDSLGIPVALIAEKGLPFHPVADVLDIVEVGADGRAHHLVPAAARAWKTLRQAASRDGVVLEIVSAFRGLEEQSQIIRAKLALGLPLDEILTLSAPPGYSEHHTGCAVDVNTPDCAPREAPFEHTDAFDWLSGHAGEFGFSLSYPRGNASGFIFEPWHWFFDISGERGSR